ncbi:MAG: phage portal protein [Chloroflexi bacterium]|nr:phage portal protein [Chloroflexota bacterium]
MILKTLFRGIENPATPLSDPDNWLIDAIGGGTSSSGVLVNSETALTYPAVFRGVALISGDVAKIPFYVYERRAGGLGKDRAKSHPAYRLLRHKANEVQTASAFRELLQAQAVLQGNGYAWIERAKTGAPGALLPLNPALTNPLRLGGKVWYETIIRGGERILIPWTDVIHIKGLPSSMHDGLRGVSVIAKAAEALGLGMAAISYGARFFANDSTPRAVLEHPGKLNQKGRENLREGWERMNRGVSNSHRTAILEEGMKLHAFSITPEDAQLLATREHEIRATVANFLGIPPHMLGDNSRTSFSSLESETQSYLDRSLDPWLAKWESEAWDKLLTDRQQRADSHLCEFLRSALVRANLKERFAAYAVALTNGILNIDEVRDRENLNPLPDGLGQEYRVPLNLQVVGEDPPEPDPPPPVDPDPDGAEAPDGPGSPGGPDDEDDEDERCVLLTDAVGRVLKRLQIAADRLQDTGAWLSGPMPDGHRNAAEGILSPVLAVCGLGDRPAGDYVLDLWTSLRGDPGAWADLADPIIDQWRNE